MLYGSEALGGVVNIITKDQMKNSLRVAAGNKGQRDYAATIGMGKASLALGRNEFGSTGNMTERLGTRKINGTDVPYYIGFGDSKKIIWLLTINLMTGLNLVICSIKRNIQLIIMM